ncbi:hypothetical protein FANTH_12248 [Fusarium anthophilum]|uniref:Uncharacterized protein n=1 Tax=Fusarium anthophilum TaxID=48485 RepID=A0A8H4YUG6_9HYPO|nr:hypothetical protein FANTH_12248 [Fusarium anthophilum]
MDRDDREDLSRCLFWSIRTITCRPREKMLYPEPRFEITSSITEKYLALLDPEEFLSQALRYYQNYLQHKELRKRESLIHWEMMDRLCDNMYGRSTPNDKLLYTTGNWLEELLGTSGEQAISAPSTDLDESEIQLTAEIETTTDMEIDSPGFGTGEASFVELPSEATSEPQNPMQAARKRRVDDGYDTGESSGQVKKRARISQESYKRGIKRRFSAIS